MTYGVTSDGFVAKPLETITAELESALREAFGSGINLAPQSALSTLSGIFAGRESMLWELAEGVHLAADPDAAEGASLDSLMALTGARRLQAQSSVVTATATGTPGTVLPVGRVASVTGSGARFATTAAATITAVDAWAADTFAAGARVTNGGGVYQVTTAGTSVTGPTGAGSDIADGGTARWLYLGSGTAAIDVECEAVETGPTPAVAGALAQIETPVSGWSTVTNVEDATLGRDVETDPAARSRREELLATAGSSIIDAVHARVRAVAGVDAVAVFENATDASDGDGIPPHAFEALVVGGDADAIAQAIWSAKPAGIAAHGSTSGTATDAEGNERTVEFTVPTPIAIYVVANLTKNGDYPADGDAQVKAALAAYGATRGFGDDVIASPLAARCFMVPGVVDVTSLYIGTSPSPGSSATIPIATREIADLDTGRITVVAT